MKSKKLAFCFGWILVMLLVSSCGISGDMATETISTASTPIDVFPTATLTRIVPTSTIRSIPTSSKTPSPTSSATIITIPTLAVEEARVRLMDLLANNGGCQLPCFFGITPGTTTNLEATRILAPLSSLSDFNGFNSDSGTISLNNELNDGSILHIYMGFLSNQDNVYDVYFDVKTVKDLGTGNGAEDIFDSTDFGERLDFYMLHHVLATLGRPSSVLLYATGEPIISHRQGRFRLILLYPEQGILVEYTTVIRVVGNNKEGCLANAHVEMNLFPPGNPDAFFEYLDSTYWPQFMASYIPLEEATSLSIDDFYEIFRQPTDECLVTPARLWPTPEN